MLTSSQYGFLATNDTASNCPFIKYDLYSASYPSVSSDTDSVSWKNVLDYNSTVSVASGTQLQTLSKNVISKIFLTSDITQTSSCMSFYPVPREETMTYSYGSIISTNASAYPSVYQFPLFKNDRIDVTGSGSCTINAQYTF